jgi:hypothetical protein
MFSAAIILVLMSLIFTLSLSDPSNDDDTDEDNRT